MVVVYIRRQDPPQMHFVEDDDMIKALSPTSASRAAAQPITLSTKRFCQGERGAVTTSSMSMALTSARTAAP